MLEIQSFVQPDSEVFLLRHSLNALPFAEQMVGDLSWDSNNELIILIYDRTVGVVMNQMMTADIQQQIEQIQNCIICIKIKCTGFRCFNNNIVYIYSERNWTKPPVADTYIYVFFLLCFSVFYHRISCCLYLSQKPRNTLRKCES